MAELSKTARASMGKAVKEVHVETVEEAIRAIRLNRDAKGFIGDMSRIDRLLEAFDREREAVKLLAESTAALLKRAETAEATVTSLQDEVYKLNLSLVAIPVAISESEILHAHEIARMADEGCPHDTVVMAEISAGQSFEAGVTQILSPEKIAMAEIPAQAEDENHMVDFGHHTIHSQVEGGS
jgi:hypothetical protein